MTTSGPAHQPDIDQEPANPRRDAQRAALLDAASRMLMHGGPDAISIRKLAVEVGASTMSIYTAFGGKDGLISALYEEAFDRLGATQRAVPRDPDPLVWLASLGRAYHEFALTNPSYYALMISVTMPVSEAMRHTQASGVTLPARGISGHPSYQYLLDAVKACIDEGYFSNSIEPIMIADAFWAVAHGLCSLELAGFHASAEEAEARFVTTTRAVMTGFLTGKGRARMNSAVQKN